MTTKNNSIWTWKGNSSRDALMNLLACELHVQGLSENPYKIKEREYCESRKKVIRKFVETYSEYFANDNLNEKNAKRGPELQLGLALRDERQLNNMILKNSPGKEANHQVMRYRLMLQQRGIKI